MKLLLALGLVSLSVPGLAFDLKAMVEKAAKDEKMQQQAKDLAKKGYEYFQEKKEDGPKKEVVKAQKSN